MNPSYLGQAPPSRTERAASSLTSESPSSKSSCGSLIGLLRTDFSSLAIPRTERASGLFVVISYSIIQSSSPRTSLMSFPISTSSGRIIIPEEDSVSPSSSSEQSIPLETTPLSLLFFIFIPIGSFEP